MPLVCPGLRDSLIPPCTKSARCLSSEVVWGQARAIGRGEWNSVGVTLEDGKCGRHGDADVPMAAGTKAPCLRTALCFELPVFAARGVGALFRVSLIAQEFMFSLPCSFYHLISVSSWKRLVGNQGT